MSDTKNKCTLLHLAAFQGKIDTVKDVLSQGSDAQEKTANGEPLLFTTLMLALGHDKAMMKKKQAIFKWLVKEFPSLLEQRNKANDTVLHIMAVYGYSDLIKNTLSHSESLAFVANNLSHCPIHTTILNGQHACFEQLIGIKGVPLLQDSQGRNALHYAASCGSAEMLSLCLNALPKDMVDARDDQSQTPLMKAIIANKNNTISIIKELLKAGAAINLTDLGMKSALDYAEESNNLAIVQLLLEKSEHPN